jgi:hypothetical protein
VTLRRSTVVLGVAAWLAAIGFGVHALRAHATTAGRIESVPSSWPEASALRLATDGWTVVMFVHPDCPCTPASLAELAVLARHPRARVTIVGDGVTADPDGVEARRFGAATSGHLVVYGEDGRLAFAGGITGSRGHRGDNTGRRAVERILDGEPASPTHDVFGCGLP